MLLSSQLSTEFPFTLPRGLIDAQRQVHRRGSVRLATVKDELLVQSLPSVGNNPAHKSLLMLSQVISRLRGLSLVSLDILEQLTLRDIIYLREFSNRVNQQGDIYIPTECPHCQAQFAVELAREL